MLFIFIKKEGEIMTLDDLIIETADYVGEELVKVLGVYDADSLIIVNKIIRRVNEAKDLLAKTYEMLTMETITLDSDSNFAATPTKTLNYINRILVHDSESEEIEFEEIYDNKIHCETTASTSVDVEYYYIPADMANLTDIQPFPLKIQPNCMSFYAAYKYFISQGGDSARKKSLDWLRLWNQALGKIPHKAKPIKDVYNLNMSGW
jgi:hypothetical protein